MSSMEPEEKSPEKSGVDGTMDEKVVEPEVEEKDAYQLKKENAYRQMKTAYLLCVFIGFGICTSIGGPAIPDLATRLCVTLSKFSISMSIGAVGSLIGAITFGLLIDRFQKHADLLLGCTLFVLAAALLVKPFIPWFGVFILFGFIEALGYSGTDAGSNCMLFGLWGAKVNGPLHALHLCWGIGATMGPFVIRPFLGSDKSVNGTNGTNVTTELDCDDDSQVEYAFMICSFNMALLGTIAVILYLTGPPKGMVIHARPIKSLKQVFDVSTIGGGDKRFGISILCLFALFYFANAGREHVFSAWLFTYAVESDLAFTKDEAALLDAANKGSFMLGRVLATPISHFAPIQPMLFTEIYTVMLLVTGLATLGTTTKTMLWVFSCLMSFVSSPIWPGGLTWTDKYIPVTAIVFTVMSLGSATAGFVFQALTGYLFTYQSPDDVMYVLVACSMFLCLLIVIMQVVASKKGNRYDRSQEATEDKLQLSVKPSVDDANTYENAGFTFENTDKDRTSNGNVNGVAVSDNTDQGLERGSISAFESTDL